MSSKLADLQEVAIRQAEQAADRILMEACQGDTTLLFALTLEMSYRFLSKSRIMANMEVAKKLLLDPKFKKTWED